MHVKSGKKKVFTIQQDEFSRDLWRTIERMRWREKSEHRDSFSHQNKKILSTK